MAGYQVLSDVFEIVIFAIVSYFAIATLRVCFSACCGVYKNVNINAKCLWCGRLKNVVTDYLASYPQRDRKRVVAFIVGHWVKP